MVSNVIFWPSTRPKNAILRWCTGRKWHIPVIERDRVGGLRLIICDKVKVPLCHYRVMHRKRLTSELHDSYFRLMTIKHSILKIEWESKDYITQLSSTSQDSWVRRAVPVELLAASWRRGLVGKATPGRRGLGPWWVGVQLSVPDASKVLKSSLVEQCYSYHLIFWRDASFSLFPWRETFLY